MRKREHGPGSGKWRGLLGAMALILAALASAGCVRLAASFLGVSAGRPIKTTVEHNVMVPMRDGVKLATDVYRPADNGAYPVVLTRLPYGKDNIIYQEVGKLLLRNGYIFVIQDTRGEFASEGDWFPFVFEYEDGHDTVAWVARQPWCNGKIGGWGGSYFGYTQLEAAPDNPALTCMVPLVASGSMLPVIFRGGAQEMVSIQGWLAGERTSQLKRLGKPGKVEPDFTGYFNAPIRDAQPIELEKIRTNPADVARGPDALIQHPGDVEDLSIMNYDRYYSRVSTPSLMVAGWYDVFTAPMFTDFVRLRADGQGNAKKSRLIVGPWVHGIFASHDEKPYWEGFAMVGTSFIAWYDYWMRGVQNGIADQAPLRLFVMGENVWRDEQEWPLARTKWTDCFLSSNGHANTEDGDGRLTFAASAGSPDQYDYDPRQPVPSAGGNFLGTKPYKPGPQDQGQVPHRKDVLVYQTEPLAAPIEVTGPVSLVLYAASSAKDTDWVAKLLDVDERGKPRLLLCGIIRARYRSGYQRPTALEPNQVYEYTIDLWPTSNLFQTGHRIALYVTSSDFPQFDRNSNGGGEGGPQNIVIAHQTVYHDAQHQSRLHLPVIPR